nr:hypothetical protein [Pseudomonas sp. LD120]
MLMNWIDPQTGWRIMLHNAERAQDCFNDRDDFVRAYVLRRQQWVAAFRADSLGQAFDEASLSRLGRITGVLSGDAVRQRREMSWCPRAGSNCQPSP